MRNISNHIRNWVGACLIFGTGLGGIQSLAADSLISIGLSQSQFFTESPLESKSQGYSRAYTQFAFDANSGGLSFGSDLRWMIFKGKQAEQTIAAPELFIGLDSQDKIFFLDLGRKKHQWSLLDQYWGFGIWQPVLNWGRVFSEQQGLTGAFAGLKVKKFRLMGFVSGLYLPSQAGTVRVENGQVTAEDRWYQDTFTILEFSNVHSDVSYELVKIDLAKLVSQWSIGFQVGLGEIDKGGWIHASYGNKPMNQVYFGVEGGQDLSGSAIGIPTRLKLHGVLARHNVVSIEMGTAGENKKFWASLIHDSPSAPEMDPKWERIPLMASSLLGFYYDQRLNFLGLPGSFSMGFLKRYDEKPDVSSDIVSVKRLASFHRIPFVEAWSMGWKVLGGNWRYSDFGWDIRYIYSPTTQGGLVTSQFKYQATKNWSAYLNLDVVGSDSEEEGEFFYRNQGNDRVQGGFVYAF